MNFLKFEIFFSLNLLNFFTYLKRTRMRAFFEGNNVDFYSPKFSILAQFTNEGREYGGGILKDFNSLMQSPSKPLTYSHEYTHSFPEGETQKYFNLS